MSYRPEPERKTRRFSAGKLPAGGFCAFLTLLLTAALLLSSCGNLSRRERPEKNTSDSFSEEPAGKDPSSASPADSAVLYTDLGIGADGESETDFSAGHFDPFYCSTETEEAVSDLVFSKLLSLDNDGNVIFGEQTQSLLCDYSVYFTDAYGTAKAGAAASLGTDKSVRTVYDLTLKNGLKFSDGSTLDGEDVMFTLYTVLDPAFDGTVDFASLPIVGLDNYRQNAPDDIISDFRKAAERIFSAGSAHRHSNRDRFTLEEQELYWNEIFPKAGEQYAEELTAYCMEHDFSSVGVGSVFGKGTKMADVRSDEKKTILYAICRFGYAKSAGGGKLVFASGKSVDLTEDYPTYADFWKLISDSGSQSPAPEGVTLPQTLASDAFVSEMLARSDYDPFGDIPGIVLREVVINGVSHDLISITLDGVCGNAAEALGIRIVSREQCTAGYTYAEQSKNYHGVDFGSAAFFSHLHSALSGDGYPIGSGQYRIDRIGKDRIELVKNEYFSNVCIDGKNPGAYRLCFCVPEKKQTASFLTLSADGRPTDGTAGAAGLEVIADYPSDRWITLDLDCTILRSADLRRAVLSTIDPDAAKEALDGYADVLPADERAIPFDPTGAAAEEYLKLAGFERRQPDSSSPLSDIAGNRAEFLFGLSEVEEEYGRDSAVVSALRAVFEKSCDVLNRIGASASITESTETETDQTTAPAVNAAVRSTAALKFADTAAIAAEMAAGFGSVTEKNDGGLTTNFPSSDASFYFSNLLLRGGLMPLPAMRSDDLDKAERLYDGLALGADLFRPHQVWLASEGLIDPESAAGRTGYDGLCSLIRGLAFSENN